MSISSPDLWRTDGSVLTPRVAMPRTLLANSIPTIEPNNTGALSQQNAAATGHVELLRLDNTNRVALAPAGNQIACRGSVVVQTPVGQSWTDPTISRGLLLQEGTSTRWNLSAFGTTTTLEAGANLTIAGARELGLSAASGTAPDCVTSRHSVVLATNTAASMLVVNMAANSTCSFEIDLSCKNASGSAWGLFKKSGIATRIGAAAPVIGAQSTVYMLRSSLDFEPFLLVGPNYFGVFATSNAIAPILTWTGTVRRIVQT